MDCYRTRAICLILSLIVVMMAPRCEAATAPDIDGDIRVTLDRFFNEVSGTHELANRAAGILVFPSVMKAGFGFGADYGEGALLVRAQPVGYYNLLSGSFGFQLGFQIRSVIIMFMTDEALARFERSYGWRVGLDGSIAFVTLGVGGSIDSDKITAPIIGFIFDPSGLMYNLTLEGSKITRIDR